MKQEAPYKCDGPGCEQTKGPANRWWMLREDPPDTVLTIRPWDNGSADRANTKHYCSEKCVSNAVSKWMETAA